MPIHNADVAKIVYKAFFQKAFEHALNTIKKNREKHGIENKETGLMVCTPPGIQELEFLSELQSFDDIENHFIDERRKIFRSAGLTEDEIQELEADIAQSKKETLERYKHPIESVTHDTTLAPEILAEIKRLLIKVGINPLAVTINNKTAKEMRNGFAWARGSIRKNVPAELTFCQENIIKASIEYTIFAIGHEIGHLLRNHSIILSIFEEAAKRSFFKKKGRLLKKDEILWSDELTDFDLEFEKFSLKMKQLHELEADTTYLMIDIDIAKITQKKIIRNISSGQKDTAKDRTDIHMSINKHFHWARKILQLHQKASLQKQDNSFDIVKE